MIAPSTGRPIRIDCADSEPRRLVYRGKPAAPALFYWCASRNYAEALAGAALADLDAAGRRLGRGWLDLTTREGAESIEAAARRHGIHTESNAAVERYAAEAIAHVDARLAQMQERGELKSLNRAYREYREAKTAAGERAMNYSTWLAQFRLKMIRGVAETARLADRWSFGDIGDIAARHRVF